MSQFRGEVTTAADSARRSARCISPLHPRSQNPPSCCADARHTVDQPGDRRCRSLDELRLPPSRQTGVASPASTVPEAGVIVTVGVVGRSAVMLAAAEADGSQQRRCEERFASSRVSVQPAASSSQTSSLLPISFSSPISFYCGVRGGSNEFYLNSVRCKLSPELPGNAPPVGTSLW